MARQETVISAPIRGAARSLDMSFPSPQTETVGNVAQGIQWFNRQGITVWDMGSQTAFGVPPAGSGWGTYKGRVAHKTTGSGTSGGFYRTGNNFGIYFPQTKQAGVFRDDFACWRVMGILAFDGSSLGAGDIGLEVAPNFNYDIVVGAPPGFQLAPTAAGAVSLRVSRNGGGVFTVNQVVANVDVNEWHAYEMRFIGATDTVDGVFKAFVDGAQVAQFSWGAGTLLPGWTNGGGAGYMVGVGNRGAAATYICKNGLQIAAAPTEAALL